MFVRQNMLSTIMLKNVKLCHKTVKLQLTRTEICRARNLCSNPRTHMLVFCYIAALAVIGKTLALPMHILMTRFGKAFSLF